MSPAARTWLLAAALFAICCYPGFTGATNYTVGDSVGWSIPSGSSYYQTWAANKTFMVGDTLSFNWTGTHDVASVSKADYDACTKVKLVSSYPIQIQLQASGPLYYICTVGPHCILGQKLAITVAASSTMSSPSPAAVAPSAASSLSMDLFYFSILFLVMFG